MTTTDEILKDRGADYGDFGEMSGLIQTIKGAMRNGPGWRQMTAGQHEALDLIATKIGRLCTGNPHKIDTWQDIEGYARLGAGDVPFTVEKRK